MIYDMDKYHLMNILGKNEIKYVGKDKIVLTSIPEMNPANNINLKTCF